MLVKAILATLSQLPVQGWYDGAEIPPGGRFPEEIQNGVLCIGFRAAPAHAK